MSEPRLILGTAGHIDHGKTALVRALTGVDCDRLPEEKERGITIELGFAPLDLPSGRRIGIVDVPGHERLVRTMVAGAAGVDLVMFVVAADEGVMPQSREHLAICDLLGIDRGIVVLTKIDAVEPDLVELAELEVAEELSGTSLEGAEIFPVSALRGDGMSELLDKIDALAAEAVPRTARGGPAWLPVDRAFTMKGFGTVVTGTLRGAALQTGQAVELLPEGSRTPLETKVRGLQVHGETVSRAEPGSRCAVNLHGVEVRAVPRGSVVATPGRVDYRPRVGVELRLLPSAPTLPHGASTTVHIGTAERNARLLLLDRDTLEPGESALCELRFDRPVAAVESERFILRGFSRLQDAGWTVGGGTIVDTNPLRGRRRAQRASDLIAVASDESGGIATRLKRAGLRGLSESELLRTVRSIDTIEGVQVGRDRWLHPNVFDELKQRTVAAVRAQHADQPTDAWVGFAALRGHLPASASDEAVRAALDAAARDGELESGGNGYRDPEHAAHVADPELAAAAREHLASAGLGADSVDHLAKKLGCEPRQLRTVLEHLANEGFVSRASADFFFPTVALEALRSRLVDYLETHGEITPAGYKELTGQSRKQTVPLMEYFDAQRVTIRRENVRVLRGVRSE